MSALAEYQKIADKVASDYVEPKTRITVGMATCGLTAGAQEVYDCAKKALAGKDGIVVDRVGCIGACFLEPIM